jgi:hypothetical protein
VRLLAEGDAYRLLPSLALLNALSGRLDIAARIAGFQAAQSARIGDNASVLTAFVYRRLDPLLAGLPAGERARREGEGAAWSAATAFETALAFDA